MRGLTIYFPGFPGSAAPLEKGQFRLSSIFAKIAQDKGREFLLHTYPGIKELDNSFSFLKSIQSAESLIERINSTKHVTLIAQSWGATVLLNLLPLLKEKIDKIIFITPYIFLPQDLYTKSLIQGLSSLYPRLINEIQCEEFSAELAEIRSQNIELLNKDFISHAANKISLVSALKDEVIPRSDITRFKDIICCQIRHLEINCDHNFTQVRNDYFFNI